MAQQRNSNYEQFFLVEDAKVRESFRTIYDNTANLQAQLDRLYDILVNGNGTTTDLATIQTTIDNEFLQ